MLHGARVYTVYLLMPGKNWILQFCPAKPANGSAPVRISTLELQFEPPLTPPTAIEQFDFHRPGPMSAAPSLDPGSASLPAQAGVLPASAPLATRESAARYDMLVLHGMIAADGSVSDLTVLRGGDALVNEAASAAFRRWRFKPALQDGKPVAVEILVGIPNTGGN